MAAGRPGADRGSSAVELVILTPMLLAGAFLIFLIYPAVRVMLGF